MALPRQGRVSIGSASAKLGARDPRLRRNAQGSVTDNDLAPGSLERDSEGRARVAAFDGIGALPEDATLADVIARLNLVVRKGQGA
jgi:hypothetical protein